jgi:hypothetical protein
MLLNKVLEYPAITAKLLQNMCKKVILIFVFSPFAFVLAQKGEAWVGLHSGFGIQTIIQIRDRNVPSFSPISTGARETGLSFSYLFTKNMALYFEGAIKQHWQEYYHGRNHVSVTINSARYTVGMRMPFKISPNGLELVMDYGYYYENEYLRFNENYNAAAENLKPPLINNYGLLAAVGLNFRFSQNQRIVPSLHFKVNIDANKSNKIDRHSHLMLFGVNYML